MTRHCDPDLLHLQAAEALAETIVCTVERCNLDGNPLNQLQQSALIAHALMAFDGMGERCNKASDMARTLRQIERLDEP